MRNPKWHRDEVILALDLYFRGSKIDAKNPEVVQLSKVLNALPIHSIKPDKEKFRNPNGVSLKLSNFLSIDPNYAGKGMESHSKMDAEVFHEFTNNRDELHRIAVQITRVAKDSYLNQKVSEVSDSEEDRIDAREGKILFKLHQVRERDPALVRKKKSKELQKHGKLQCEACGFDFAKVYGDLGNGFIECHHRLPLAEMDPIRKTSLEDLALVCSNCHRMLHRAVNSLSIEDLRKRMSIEPLKI